ncbi:MAG TPA: MFS transporter [Acidimicrobiia bacterium]
MSAKPKLGARYWRIWWAASVSTLGDGVRLVALPLLATTLTRDPVLVALVTLAQGLPWLLFALVSGALVDRLDRRRVMWSVDLVRAAIAVTLAITAALGVVTIWLLCLLAFLLGTAQTLFDNAAQAIMPMVVGRDRLEQANSKLFGAQVVTEEFVGPPLGALLFAAAVAAPFVLDASSFLIAALLVFTMPGSFRAAPVGDAPRTRLRHEIAEGLRWLWHHRLLRTLALMLSVWMLVETATGSIFVLFALETVHVSKTGYGLLFSAGALGSAVGSAFAPRIAARFGDAPSMLAGVVVNALGLIIVAAFPQAVVVGVMGAVGGAAALVWNVITVSLRQTLIPDHLLGRVNSVYRFLGWGSMPIGAALGGVIAGVAGLRAPFFMAGGILLLLALAGSRVVNPATVARARADAAAERGGQEPAGEAAATIR